MRNCCVPERRVRDITRTRAGAMDETLPRKSVAGVQGTSHMTSQEHASEFTDIRVSRKMVAPAAILRP